MNDRLSISYQLNLTSCSSADATTVARAHSPKHILFLLLVMTTSATALFAPSATQAQQCLGNVYAGCLNAGAVCSPVESGVGPSGHCTTTPHLPPGERDCNCAGAPEPPPPPGPCSDRTATGKIECTINQPVVTQHETEYPTVAFAPGDIVEVKADGCVQTGGWGDTWKRYVNPTGPNSDHLYHGLIRIPTGTKDSALVRINTVMGSHLQVTGANVPVSQLILHLGYEDDDYSDNGYYDHDNGTEDQCKTDTAKGIDGGPAHVTITIFRGVLPDPPQSRFDFDILPKLDSNNQPILDPNGLLYNPHWSWQQRPENQGQIPDTSLCHNFSKRDFGHIFSSPNFPDCTDQADLSTVDLPIGINRDLCEIRKLWPPWDTSTDIFAGHVNWFPVTLEGSSGPVDHNADDDYSFTFHSDEPGNPLSVSGRGGLHVEFDSDETIDHFTTKEWTDFHNAVDASKSAQAALVLCYAPPSLGGQPCSDSQIQELVNTIKFAEKLFAGHAILTGMFGLDGEHNLKAELHPLYAIANRRDNYENDPSDEVWLMFVRNQGDEGFCSSQLWDAGFENYTFRLPWRPGMIGVDVNWEKTRFVGTDGTSGPFVAVRRRPPSGVYVTFHLGPAVHSTSIFETSASIPFIEGALHLTWTGPVIESPVSSPREEGRIAAEQADEDEVEHWIGGAIYKLPAPQRRQVEKARKLASAPAPKVHKLPPTGPVQTITDSPPVPRIGGLKAINSGPAVQKAERDAAQIRALCAASDNAPAGMPSPLCKSPSRALERR